MPFLSIKDAAIAAGISRTAFYKQYILPGKISVNRADPKKPVIDTSEILRVFGTIQGDRQAAADKSPSPTARINELEQETAAQRAEIGGLRAALAAKDDHIQTLKAELAAAKEREIRLLPQPPQPQKGFWGWLRGS